MVASPRQVASYPLPVRQASALPSAWPPWMAEMQILQEQYICPPDSLAAATPLPFG